MDGFDFTLAGARLTALPSRALWWEERRLLAVSDLHLGKSRRAARRGGAMLPPYEVRETLMRLESLIDAARPATVVCLGDSFDDPGAEDDLDADDLLRLTRLMAGREWIWVEGNHDPGPVGLGGAHVAAFSAGPLTFRHIAATAAGGEVSGHYHPKIRLALGGAALSCPVFLIGGGRAILPAFGTYTGGLDCRNAAFSPLLGPAPVAVLTGRVARGIPLGMGGT